jgi:uncharacterized membrane protein
MRFAAGCLGFALGGFLDGVLLHQILQWHHLLSGVTDPADWRFQMAWDGAFHAAHYAIALLGLVLLWRRRREAAAPGAGRATAGAALLGFGAWHLLDAVVNHWALGLHRINETVADPLPWDLVFFALGLVTAAAGGWLLRGRGGPGAPVAAGLAALVLLAGPAAALPPREPDPVARLLAGGTLPAFCAAWTRYAAR